MINSIYTHHEIFLRELISNASDALDKMYYKSLTENDGMSREDFYIRLTPDKEARTLTVSDNGCGMTAEELENNLGTIAKSGSLAFKQENEAKEDIDIIGQFGVGFYPLLWWRTMSRSFPSPMAVTKPGLGVGRRRRVYHRRGGEGLFRHRYHPDPQSR